MWFIRFHVINEAQGTYLGRNRPRYGHCFLLLILRDLRYSEHRIRFSILDRIWNSRRVCRYSTTSQRVVFDILAPQQQPTIITSQSRFLLSVAVFRKKSSPERLEVVESAEAGAGAWPAVVVCVWGRTECEGRLTPG